MTNEPEFNDGLADENTNTAAEAPEATDAEAGDTDAKDAGDN